MLPLASLLYPPRVSKQTHIEMENEKAHVVTMAINTDLTPFTHNLETSSPKIL